MSRGRGEMNPGRSARAPPAMRTEAGGPRGGCRPRPAAGAAAMCDRLECRRETRMLAGEIQVAAVELRARFGLITKECNAIVIITVRQR